MKTIFLARKKEVSLNELRTKFTPPLMNYTETPLKKTLDLMQDEAVKLGLADEKINKLLMNNILKAIVWPLLTAGLTMIYMLFMIDYFNTITAVLMVINFTLSTSSMIIISRLSMDLTNLTAKGERGRKTYKDLKQFIKKQPLTEG
jgi:hypothetical protein